MNLVLHKGEILGLAGLVGAGRTELARAIFGADKISTGTVQINGKTIEIKNIRHAIAHKIGLVQKIEKNKV